MDPFRLSTVLALSLVLGCQGVSKLALGNLFTEGGRATWQKPREVVATLEIQPGDQVADLGAGEGYFVPYLAEAVGPQGRVFAVDVDVDAVRDLEIAFDGEGSNVEVVFGDYGDPKLPDGQIDLVLIVNVYHHLEDRPEYFARLRTDLSQRGRVAIIEPNAELGGVLGLLVSDEHASQTDAIRLEMQRAGYREVASSNELPVQVFAVFQPEPSTRWGHWSCSRSYRRTAPCAENPSICRSRVPGAACRLEVEVPAHEPRAVAVLASGGASF